MCKYLTLFVLLFLLFSCSEDDKSSASNFPYENYNYSINNINLGLSFVPDSNTEQQNFTATHLSTLNISRVRFAQSWHLREPTNNDFNWAPLASRLDFYDSNNVEVLLTLDIKEFPAWTTALDSTQLTNEFNQYVNALLTNFGSRIAYIQLGNEWNWEIDTYLNGDEDLFIALNNIVYDNVMSLSVTNRPVVVLGSISIGGLQALAFNQSRITNIYFGQTPLYTQLEIDASAASVQTTAIRVQEIMSNCSFEMLDLHFYDEYWNWPIYQAACLQVLSNVNKTSSNYQVTIVSEFGGPHPDLEGYDYSLKAERLISYVQTLDTMSVKNAYYFKLVQESSPMIAHPNSFLIDSGLHKTFSYEVLRLFGM